MGIETKRKTIGGVEYEVTQLQYVRGKRLLVKLLKLAGAPLLGIVQLAGDGKQKAALGALLQMDTAQLAPTLGTLFEQLEPATVEDLTRDILLGATALYEGRRVPLVDDGPAERWALNLVVGGDFWSGMALEAWALSVHFGNFSSARAAFGAAGLKAPASSSEASTTS